MNATPEQEKKCQEQKDCYMCGQPYPKSKTPTEDVTEEEDVVWQSNEEEIDERSDFNFQQEFDEEEKNEEEDKISIYNFELDTQSISHISRRYLRDCVSLCVATVSFFPQILVSDIISHPNTF